MKFNCYQNDFKFQPEHISIICNQLIYHLNEDIVYSTVEFLEEFVWKNSEI